MSNSSSSKSYSKKVNSRERDRNKSVASESGGSSQCDTPPLTEKEPSSSQGRYAGIGPESVICMAEQIGVEINSEAATNLAEDVSYKLRQIINNIAVQSALLRRGAVQARDVDAALALADTGPAVGATEPRFAPFGDENLCAPVESVVNVAECALSPQSFSFGARAALAAEWVTEERTAPPLQLYYTRVARAILSMKKKPKEAAVADLSSNARIGPIFPNLLNLAVLVLNDDNLAALHVPAKRPLQSRVLDMVAALCRSPAAPDTDVRQQFQRLFPVMVSNILGNGSLSEKMVTILTQITRTWPSFVGLGKEILVEYLAGGAQERLTAPMLACITALGRAALAECLAPHLARLGPAHRGALLDAATALSGGAPWLEEHVATDYTLYELLGDALQPRRTLRCPTAPQTVEGKSAKEKSIDDDFSFATSRAARPTRLRLLRGGGAGARGGGAGGARGGGGGARGGGGGARGGARRDAVFEGGGLRRAPARVQVKVKGFRTIAVRAPPPPPPRPPHAPPRRPGGVLVASGLLNRFRYRLNRTSDFPIFGFYVI